MEYEVESGESDSEAELQAAFALGIIQPGLNIEDKEKKTFVNDKVALNRKLNNVVLSLPWIERLDLNSKPAKMAPEFIAKLQEQKEKDAKNKITSNPVENDFERELIFHRQAQAAVLEGVSRLKEINIPTKRPDDYFAEMAKSDSHMQKVRTSLLKKQHAVERAEKVRQIRKMRKVSKEVQKQAKVRKENEKREFLDQVKKYRKKISSDLSFLDSKPKPKAKPLIDKAMKNISRRAQNKRKLKDKKYGMGGKKRGNKHNTRESVSDISGKRQFVNRKKLATRPGKSKRAKQKGRRKR